MPIFRETLLKVTAHVPDVQVAIPTVPHVAALIAQETKNWPVKVHLIDNDVDKYDAFAASRAALACSGTVSVELALAQLPTVIAYKIGTFTAALYRRFIKTRFATLINIMLDRMVMPEFLQENCTPDRLAEAVATLLTNNEERMKQIQELASIGEWLGRGQFIPSQKAAETVWRVAFPVQKKYNP